MSKSFLLPFFVAAMAATLTLPAQDAAKPTAPTTTPPLAPAAPPADPFVRDPRAAKAPAPAAPVPPVNLLTTVETWSLSQADFLTLFEGQASNDTFYERLEALAKSGKAKLLGLLALSTKTRQRAILEVIDEVRYASTFDPPARPGEIAFPTTWETRNVGDTLELLAVLGPDGKTIDIDLVPQSVRLVGFEDWQPEAATAAPVSLPRFDTEKVTTSMRVQSGRPALLATTTPANDSEVPKGRQVRIQILRVAAQAAPPPPAPAPSLDQARIEFLLYSMDREAARRLLAGTPDSAQSHRAVEELVGKGEAQLELVAALVTKSGQRCVSEEQAEIRYPTAAKPPSPAASTPAAESRQPAMFSAFETRNTGLTLEVEPIISADGRFVEINLVPQIVRLLGTLKATGIAAKYPPQPLFTTRKVTTSAVSGIGLPILLGTLSQPRDTGANDRKDDGRTTLAYVRVTPVGS